MAIPLDKDPAALFRSWLGEAAAREPNDPAAACLATASRGGAPSARMAPIESADSEGFAFYTDLGSRKAAELAENPRAALCRHWKSLRRTAGGQAANHAGTSIRFIESPWRSGRVRRQPASPAKRQETT